MPGDRTARWKHFSEAEDEVLRAHYEAGGTAAVRRFLPGRDAESIQRRAVRLKLARNGKRCEKSQGAPKVDDRALAHALGMNTVAPAVPAGARVVRRLA